MLLKCKMCGGDLEITPGSSVATCEYCGSQQTAPNADNEKKNNLYNRANRLRFSNDFDKAAGVFESIVAEFPDEAEAYWGLCLCKYGIEYVDDPLTAKKIPTCHRTAFESIFDDLNYKNAMEYAYPEAQNLYHAEAKEIERLQKAILEIVKNETPYDVFICYKETDEKGQRTKDSVQAQDIYTALTDAGFKIFFARITLEDKLGEEYEPYIFSALNSAKVMLVVGTSFENMNATWVKNEWARYIQIMKKEKGRSLIPCYSDMDAYDMPEEFRNLQAQDMNKVGFVQDLVRGVGKICVKNNAYSDNSNLMHVQGGSSELDNNIKRAKIALEDKNWNEAKKYSDKVLDIDAENADAYFCLFMIENKLNAIEDILNLKIDLENNKNFAKAKKYATGTLNVQIDSILEKKTELDKEKSFEKVQRLEKSVLPWKLKQALKIYESMGEDISSSDKLKNVAKKYKKNCLVFIAITVVCLSCMGIIGYRIYDDTVVKPAKEYEAKKIEYDKAMALYDEKKYEDAKSAFILLEDFEDSENYSLRCDLKIAEDDFKLSTYEEEFVPFLENDNLKEEASRFLEAVAEKYASGTSASGAQTAEKILLYIGYSADSDKILSTWYDVANRIIAIKDKRQSHVIGIKDALEHCAKYNYKDSKTLFEKWSSEMVELSVEYSTGEYPIKIDCDCFNFEEGYYTVEYPDGDIEEGTFEYGAIRCGWSNPDNLKGRFTVKVYTKEGKLLGSSSCSH